MSNHNDRLGNGLHDADEVVGRILAHSYRDEIPPVVVWQAAPEEREHPVKVVAVILAQMAVLLLLFIGIIGWVSVASVPK